MAAAGSRVAADNPLHDEDCKTAAPADGGLFPRITHPYPCGGCAAFHDDESGFCAQCSRRRLVPPQTVAMLARAQRRFYLALLTLIMSMFETSDKVIIIIFALSATMVVLLSFLTKAVASQYPGRWIAGLVLVVAAAVCCGPAVRRMIRSIEAVDSISDEFDTAAKKLLADRDESQRGPASFKPAAPRSQPSWELRDLYVLARERRDLFAVEVLEVLARAGKQATEPSRVIRGPSVKGLARAREKTILDYGGDASRLRDVLRGSIVCETVDELNVVVDALRAVKDVEVIRIKNRFRDKPTPSGYRDVNINIDYHGMVVELQLHLSEVLQVADKQHVAYEAARELDLMGVLEKPDASSLSEAAPIEMKVAYNLARFVPALLSLLVAILYLDVFTFKGLRLIVRRADPKTWRGFDKPYIVHRVYGIALAAPYLVNVYMLARAAGLFGEAAKDARRGRTRVGLLYEKYFGYEGSHFVWKVFCFQIVEVALQAAGKIPLFTTYMGGGDGATFWFVYVFILALMVNVLYPTLLLRSRLVRYQRDVSFVADTFLDIVYALTPFVFLIAGVRSQAALIPHEPVAYVSNLIPMLHAHFVISTLERAGAEARALKRVAPDEIAAEEAPKRAVAGDAAPDEAAGIDAPAPDAGALPDDASAEASKPVPLGATPAGRRYCGLICLCLLFWTLAMGFFYTGGSPTFYFVSEVLKIKSSCTWGTDKWDYTWQERACDRPCEEIPGCGDGWCDVREGECVKSTSDDRCVGKEDRFELGHDEWCESGLRVHECEDEDDEDEDSFSYLYSYADEDEDGDEDEDAGEDEDRCSRKWPESPGDHPYEVFADSGKCRSQDSAEPDRAHDEDVGTVADIAECWRRCQGLNEDGKTSYCASMHQSTMECSCQGADSYGDFYEFDCLVDVGEYTLAVHQDWRGSRCHSDGRHVCGCDDEDYCLPYDACCVEHAFDATGEVLSTTCHFDRGGIYEGGRWPWEAATMSKLCTAGHSDAGAVAPAYRDCSQEALDAGRCGTGDWDTCAECVDDNIPTGTFFANVGYTSCPNWVFDAISENTADGGTCSHAWTKRKTVYRDTWPTACSWQLWKDLTMTDGGKKLRPWLTIMGVFTALFLVGLPFLLSFLALPTLAERAGRRLVSVWRPTFGWILWNFVSAGYLAFFYLQNQSFEGNLLPREDFGLRIVHGYLIVMGYATDRSHRTLGIQGHGQT
jgi:hypothetical protein